MKPDAAENREKLQLEEEREQMLLNVETVSGYSGGTRKSHRFRRQKRTVSTRGKNGLRLNYSGDLIAAVIMGLNYCGGNEPVDTGSPFTTTTPSVDNHSRADLQDYHPLPPSQPTILN